MNATSGDMENPNYSGVDAGAEVTQFEEQDIHPVEAEADPLPFEVVEEMQKVAYPVEGIEDEPKAEDKE